MARQITFCLNKQSGFFSLFFIMCTAYITSKKMGLPFFIIHSNWLYTWDKGWHDYFTTLKIAPFSLIQIKDNDRFFNVHYPLSEYVNSIRELFVLKPELVSRVNRIVGSLPPDFIAVFVRRGDKLIQEAKYIPVSEIFKHIPHTKTDTFFIQTDDYTVVEEIRSMLPEATIVSTVSPTKRGEFLAIAQNRPSNQVREETEEMLVGISVCLRSSSCWTDSTSNVGRFLKLSNPNVHIYPKDFDVDLSCEICPAWDIKRSS